MINSLNKQQGMSLMELLIVLMCIGMLTASAIHVYIGQARSHAFDQRLKLAITELHTATNTCLLIDNNSMNNTCSYNSNSQDQSPLVQNQYLDIDAIPSSVTSMIQLSNNSVNEGANTMTITVSSLQSGSNSKAQTIIQKNCTNGDVESDGSCELTFHVQPMGLDNAQNSQDAVITSLCNQASGQLGEAT